MSVFHTSNLIREIYLLLPVVDLEVKLMFVTSVELGRELTYFTHERQYSGCLFQTLNKVYLETKLN
jgi:hypothetical protein